MSFFSRLSASFNHSIKHEPHLIPMVSLVLGAPLLAVCSTLWSTTKSDVKITRYGDVRKQIQSIDPTRPGEILFTHKSRRGNYKQDSVVDELRNEIYAYDNFKKIN